MFNRQRWAIHGDTSDKHWDPSTYPSSIRTERLLSVLEQADLGWVNQNDGQELWRDSLQTERTNTGRTCKNCKRALVLIMNSSKGKLDKTSTNQRVALATLSICYYHILKPSMAFKKLQSFRLGQSGCVGVLARSVQVQQHSHGAISLKSLRCAFTSAEISPWWLQ